MCVKHDNHVLNPCKLLMQEISLGHMQLIPHPDQPAMQSLVTVNKDEIHFCPFTGEQLSAEKKGV